MAGRQINAYNFFSPAVAINETTSDEFDESDIMWGCDIEPRSAAEPFRSSSSKQIIPSSRRSTSRKKAAGDNRADGAAAAAAVAASLPVNIPDWSKILKDQYNNRLMMAAEFDEEEDAAETGTGIAIPPHEYLWRNRAASFSVHEGIGRTLKGRDLRRVRNAIFEKTGFQD